MSVPHLVWISRADFSRTRSISISSEYGLLGCITIKQTCSISSNYCWHWKDNRGFCSQVPIFDLSPLNHLTIVWRGAASYWPDKRILKNEFCNFQRPLSLDVHAKISSCITGEAAAAARTALRNSRMKEMQGAQMRLKWITRWQSWSASSQRNKSKDGIAYSVGFSCIHAGGRDICLGLKLMCLSNRKSFSGAYASCSQTSWIHHWSH